MKLNRKWILVMSLVLSVALATGSTLAYMTATTETKTNTFTLGNVVISLSEPAWDAEDADHTMYQGTAVPKDPTITNEGRTPAWVWMEVAIPTALNEFIELEMCEGWTEDTALVKVDGTNTIRTLKYASKLAAKGDAEGNDKSTAFTSITLSETVTDEALADFETEGTVTISVTGFAIQDSFDDVDAAYEAFNAEGAGDPPVGESVHVDTEQAMIDALAAGNSVILDGDVTVSTDVDSVIGANNNVVVDLQGHTLTSNVVNNGILNLNNGDVVTTDAGQYGINNYAGSKTTISNVDLNSAGGGIGAVDGAKVTFESGSVAVNSSNTSGRYNFYAVGEGTEVTIKGGNFSFSSTLNQKRAYIYAASGATVRVEGGTFGKASAREGYTAGILGDGTIIITGGTFGFDPSTWVAEGYEAVQSGSTWTVSAK